MIIEEQHENRITLFKNIRIGECFKRNNIYFLKTDEKNKAVSLLTGTIFSICDDDNVIPIAAKIVVE